RLGSPSEFVHAPWGQSRYYTYRGEFDLALRLAEDVLIEAVSATILAGSFWVTTRQVTTCCLRASFRHAACLSKRSLHYSIRLSTVRWPIRPDTPPTFTHSRFWGSRFSVSVIRSKHWHGAAPQSPRPGSWRTRRLWL